MLHRLAETLISIIYPTAEKKNKKLVLGFLTIENGETQAAHLLLHCLNIKSLFSAFLFVVVFVAFPFFLSRYIYYSIITICLEKELDGKRNDWQRILYTE